MINKAIKMGKNHDWLDNGFTFKVKTNNIHIYKKPVYKNEKVTKYKWKHKRLQVSQYDYWNWENKYYSNEKTHGWICYKLVQTDYRDEIPHKHFVYLKKKVKYNTNKPVKTLKYKNVKMRVYATIFYQGHNDYDGGEHLYYPLIEFKAMKNGYKTQYLDMVIMK